MKYQILQLKDLTKVSYAFMEYDYAKDHNFDLQDYEVVYEGETNSISQDNSILEELFCDFNCGVHPDFKGHSMSVSDIVQLTDDKGSRFYYCDPLGWTRLD